MSETKFTPGPWEWDGDVWDYDPDQEAPWLESHNGIVVLQGGILCSKANAHLIAAAPDIYEALEAALECNLHADQAWVDRGFAALAKANGECK